jgi:serine phosphatase RsbU (regulator of sigma subunit)
MEPAGRVGGDLYDFVETRGGVLFILGDVSGKGVGWALSRASVKKKCGGVDLTTAPST